jgi:hypothetical protein
MAPADDVDGAAKASPLWAKYGERVEADSAREMLAARMQAPAAEPAAPPAPAEAPAPKRPAPKRPPKQPAPAGGGVEAVTKFLKSREGRRLEKQVMRGVFGLLKKRL